MRIHILLLLLCCAPFGLRAEEPAPPPEPAKVEKLNLSAEEMERCVSQLDDESFEVRERAYKNLLACGSNALPVIRKALAKAADAEIKSKLNRLELLCDSGPAVDGVSLKLSIEPAVIKSGDKVKFKLTYINHTNEPLILTLGSKHVSINGKFSVIEGDTVVSARNDTGAFGKASAGGMRLSAELPAQGQFEFVSEIVVLAEPPPSPVPPAPETPVDPATAALKDVLGVGGGNGQTYLSFTPGEHTLRVKPLNRSSGPPTDTPRRYTGENGPFMSQAGRWGGKAETNEVKIVVKEK